MTSRERFVVDASVCVKWFVPEEGAATARRLLRSGQTLYAPSLVLIEVGQALWKKVSRGALKPSNAAEALTEFTATRALEFIPDRTLLSEALRIAFAIRHPLYDCLYLAAALVTESSIVTSDIRFAGAARAGGFGSRITLLDSRAGSHESP